MARMLRFTILLILILSAKSVFAAGGACPSGANYTNPASPTGPSATLASLGITNCFYVAANGADANSGADEAHPWQHAPQMPNCSGNCATVQNGTIPAGTGFIFRGGDSWHFGQNTGAYTGGTWNFNTGHTPNGTAANPIYLGVDQTWFSGGAWSRPILTGDNPICNANTLSGTCLTDILTGPAGIREYYVTSCAFQTAGGSNIIVEFDARQYFLLDNFEITGVCNSTPGQVSNDSNYISYNSANGPLTFENNYLHGWTHVRFGGQNGNSAWCTPSTVCLSQLMRGSVAAAPASPGENILFNVIDGEDSDPVGNEVGFAGAYNVAYNIIRYQSGWGARTLHSYHDNLYEFFFESGHSNVLESGNASDGGPVSVIYNNVFRHIDSSGAIGSVLLWPGPAIGGTDYIFNNLIYDVASVQYNNIGTLGHAFGSYVYFNNTFQSNVSQAIFSCINLTGGTMTDVNNHLITDASAYYGSGPTCNGVTPTIVAPLFTNNAKAKANGYTSSQTVAYSPTAANSPTVRTGTNATSTFCAAMLGSNDPLIQAAGTACQSDTSYSCTYDSQNHMVICPARNNVARPAGAWDIGAYQFASAQAGGPNPPTGLRVSVQ
jgi:hypothetical protein